MVYGGRHVLPVGAPPHLIETSWRIETSRGRLSRRYSGCRETREEAHEDCAQTVAQRAYRLMRVTTTYTIKAEHTPEPT
ncbi:hypothetical protein AB0I84_13130 [Streptomyces spectabilis]|uniref:hypothetical protein n=1 Tax=Streptomyces spectabilis TaxID=68270 RepID=UPI0033F94E9E